MLNWDWRKLGNGETSLKPSWRVSGRATVTELWASFKLFLGYLDVWAALQDSGLFVLGLLGVPLSHTGVSKIWRVLFWCPCMRDPNILGQH